MILRARYFFAYPFVALGMVVLFAGDRLVRLGVLIAGRERFEDLMDGR